ncbi:MAG: 50S ribosomal protein L18 [Lactobacillaceae bacterium]|jgi:large subunit ribosomal protein L18|nr:50S ribosomal protein L18 [Lactobacillaceae bacterium]
MNTPRELFNKRKTRVRYDLKKHASGKSRLSVFRSGRHIYAQVIDDLKGSTIVSASTLDKEIREKNIKKSSTVEAASFIGTLIAERALKSGVSEVVFDRGGYIYHGRVKALAEAARAAGLKF